MNFQLIFETDIIANFIQYLLYFRTTYSGIRCKYCFKGLLYVACFLVPSLHLIHFSSINVCFLPPQNALETLHSKQSHLSLIEDKAHQIAIEGSTVHKQFLQEQIGAICDKLAKLTTEAETNIETLEKTIADRRDFENDLTETSGWLKDVEVKVVQSHDHLGIDADSVDAGDERLAELRGEVEGRVGRMTERVREQTAGYGENGEVMGLELQDKVTEFNQCRHSVQVRPFMTDVAYTR